MNVLPAYFCRGHAYLLFLLHIGQRTVKTIENYQYMLDEEEHRQQGGILEITVAILSPEALI